MLIEKSFLLANYNPDDDEYFNKKSGNGFLAAAKLENNNTPVCNQPASGRTHQRHPSNMRLVLKLPRT